MPQRLEEGLLLRGDRELCHVLPLEVCPTLLLLPLALSTRQVLPVEDTLGIGVCVLRSSLERVPDGVQRLVCRVKWQSDIPQPPCYRYLDSMDDQGWRCCAITN